MKRPHEFVTELTNEQLYNAFEEIVELDRTGVLPDGVVRDVYHTLVKLHYAFSIDYVKNQVTYEISKRWHDEGL